MSAFFWLDILRYVEYTIFLSVVESRCFNA